MRKVKKLLPKTQRVTQDAAEELAKQLRAWPVDSLPEQPREAMLNVLSRFARDPDEAIWPGGFNMISREQTGVVWDAIRELDGKHRPRQVRHAFDLVLLNLRWDTGEVALSRDEMAAKMKCAPESVSRIMGTLENMGVVIRKRRRVEGMRGRGQAAYFINPDVAWNGTLDARLEARDALPPPPQRELRLVET